MRDSRTPESSPAGDDATQSSAKGSAIKDKQCQYCHQAFTSSSLGRHLDQYLFKKKPDGIHDVDEIRRIRSSITRRQARTSSHKRTDSPDGTGVKSHSPFDPPGAASQSDASRDGGRPSRDPATRFLFNTPTWHATGVINDIPEPGVRAPSATPDSSIRGPVAQSRAPLAVTDLVTRNQSLNNPDTARALELALREVLDNIKAAT
jgi:hypothetical protein